MQPTGPSTEATKRLVCRNCDWKVEGADGKSRETADQAAIGHYVATGHRIESATASRPRSGDDSGTTAAVRSRSSD